VDGFIATLGAYRLSHLHLLATVMSSDPGIEFDIMNVPTNVNEWTVTREVAKVLHSDDFGFFGGGRLLNFRVRLKRNEDGDMGNNGAGTLTLPVQKSGYKFLDFLRGEPIKIEGRKLRFYISNRTPSKEWLQTLSKTPFVDPDLEEQHQDTLRALEGELRVEVVQFGVFYRETYPSKSRSFSIEWEHKYIESYASLSFEYDHKLILLKVSPYWRVSLSS
jgi:RNA-dependent RNA polymerase